MRIEIGSVSNAMVGESSLPHFAFSLELHSQCVGIASFEELHRSLKGHIGRWRQQQMNVFGHDDECVQLESSLPAIAIERLQKQSCVRLYDEESAALPS